MPMVSIEVYNNRPQKKPRISSIFTTHRFMAFIPKVFAILRESGETTGLFCMLVINAVIAFIPSFFQNMILTSGTSDNAFHSMWNWQLIYGIYFCLKVPIRQWIDNQLMLKRFRINKVYTEKAWNTYAKANHKSRMEMLPVQISNCCNTACNSIQSLLQWGVRTIINIVGTFFSIFYIFMTMDMHLLFIFVIVANIIVYMLFTKKTQKVSSKLIKTLEKENERIRCQVDIRLPMIQSREKNPSEITTLKTQIELNNIEINKAWNNFGLITSLCNGIIILIVIMYQSHQNVGSFLIILGVLKDFSASFDSMMGFISEYTNIESRFTSFEKILEKLVIEDDCVKLNFHMNRIVIPAQTSVIRGNTYTIEKLEINMPSTVLVQGPSGHGKSTFLDALVGNIEGLTLGYGVSKNFSDKFSFFFQAIVGRTPFNKITIRQLFNDEPSDELIRRCLEITAADSDKWVDKLNSVNNSEHIDDDWTIFGELYKSLMNYWSGSSVQEERVEELIEIETQYQPLHVNSFDIDIDERISGGQKVRLCAATTIYKAIKGRKQCIVFDEVSQGCDDPAGYKLVKKINNAPELSCVTKIFVDHLSCLDQIIKPTLTIGIIDGRIQNGLHGIQTSYVETD